MIDALLILLPTPMMLPPTTSVVPSEFAIACGVENEAEVWPFCAPCPVVCPGPFDPLKLLPLLDDEFPNEEFPNEELPNDELPTERLPNDDLPPCGFWGPPISKPSPPPLVPEAREACPSGKSGRL